ncbi:hypothetical protein [Thiohalomonas denitrificans]|uniref:hypothetical protein n=1 Tax=Thiohalomonas denitrificans TaxID=415747 RepID=UPI0026EDCF44|nr:hypothetical protein [Thiohalomonas denitrificans]
MSTKIVLVALALCAGPQLPGCASQPSGISGAVPVETTGKASARDVGGAVDRDRADGLLAGGSATEEPAKPDFSGLWVLNVEASDDLQEKMAAFKGSMGRGQAMGGGSGGPRRGGGMGGGQGHGQSGSRMRGKSFSAGELSAMLKALDTLEIAHDDPFLSITDPDGHRRLLFTDFRGASISTSGGMQQQVTVAGWEDDVLVVETTPDSGPRLIQRYRRDGDTGQLVIVAAMVIPQLTAPLRIRYLYEPAKTGETGAISDSAASPLRLPVQQPSSLQ